MSSDEYKFDIVPPVHISPTLFFAWFGGLWVFSNDSHAKLRTPSDSSNIPGVTTSQHGMLSVGNVRNRPLSDINTPPMQSPPTVMVSEPPPGFVPFNAPPAQ